jgi:hypothetical protein
MRNTSETDQRRTLRAKLSHPDVGDVGEGKLTFGYSSSSAFSLNEFAPKVRLTEPQLAEGLVAEAEDGTKWSLYGCKGFGHSLFIDFVVENGMRATKIQKFEVRYTDVSDWFFSQMRLESDLGASIEWASMPAKLVAEVSQSDLTFKCESEYVASLVQQGEDRKLHQHFEFSFTATSKHFTLVEVRDLARRFSQLLSLLLTHPCSIVSIDVTPNGMHSGRLYYGVASSPPPEAESTDDPNLVAWRTFFTDKRHVDGCWDTLVKKFFHSKHRDVVWARLAGMQNFEGFWEYRILGYVTLLDGLVSKDFKAGTPIQPTDKLKEFETALGAVKRKLTKAQTAAVMDAATKTFTSTGTFASKFDALMKKLDQDVVKVINFTTADFKRIKRLRDQVAHALPISYKSSDLTPMLAIMNRLRLLLTYLFFLEVGLQKDVFLRCLAQPRNQLRMRADIDEVHLQRLLKPDTFFKVTPRQLEVIRTRPPKLHWPCFVLSKRGQIAYSLAYSRKLAALFMDGTGGDVYGRLGFPKGVVRHVGEAYFEDGTNTVSVHSVAIIDRSLLPV